MMCNNEWMNHDRGTDVVFMNFFAQWYRCLSSLYLFHCLRTLCVIMILIMWWNFVFIFTCRVCSHSHAHTLYLISIFVFFVRYICAPSYIIHHLQYSYSLLLALGFLFIIISYQAHKLRFHSSIFHMNFKYIV